MDRAPVMLEQDVATGAVSAKHLLRVLASAPAWQSDLARRIAMSGSLGPDDVGEVEANILASPSGTLIHGRRLALADMPNEVGDGGAPRLLGIDGIQNVGSLHPGAAITFAAKGLTVLYGNNGAGKSSYVRLLKEGCRAIDGGEKILPNVFAGGAEAPRSYRLEIEVEGVPSIIERRVGSPSDPRLGSISVLDTSCASLYVSQTMSLAYVPRSLQLMEKLAREQEELRNGWREQRAEREAQRPSFDALPVGTRAHVLMERSEPDLAAIEAFASLTEADRQRLEELERRLQSRENVNRERAAYEKSRAYLQGLGVKVAELATTGSETNIAAWRELEARVLDLEEELSSLGRALEQMVLPGVGSRSWRTLWSAAASYRAEELGGGHEDCCALCQRSFDAAAVERMRELASIAESQLETERAAAADSAAAARSTLEAALRAGQTLAELETDAPAEEATRAFAEGVASQLRSALVGALEEDARAASDPTPEIVRAIQSINTALEELSRLESTDGRAALDQELSELRARRMLGERSKDVKRAAEIGAEVSRLDSLITASGTRKLSSMTRALTDELLTGRLGEELAKARDDLKVAGLRVALKATARKGKSKFQLSLEGRSKAKLPEVLSQGERRTLALACFLAEVAASDHDGPIVLDDPVSSLDAGRRREVARRLAEEARRRQVIVFTHDPSFFALLERERVRVGVPMTVRTLSSINASSGHVRDEPPHATSGAGGAAKRLGKSLVPIRKAAKEGGVDEYKVRVDAFRKRLRDGWERLTVDALGGVLLPGTLDVHTRLLSKVALDDHLIGLIEAGMSAMSFENHYQGPMTPETAPLVSDLEREVERLERAIAYLAELRAERHGPAGKAEGRVIHGAEARNGDGSALPSQRIAKPEV